MTILAGLPGALVSVVLLWTGDYSAKLRWTLLLFVGVVWIGLSFAVRRRVVFPLQTLSNLLAALSEGDYSIRARRSRAGDALSEVMREVNSLGETLRQQRLGALEATALLRKVMAEIDVAVFAFDNHQCLRLTNRAGERLLAQSAEELLGKSAEELGLADCLVGESQPSIQRSFPGGSGRWGVRRSSFRESGVPHQLVVLSDLSRALRDEERHAWQRLLRVLGHELNNSLAPIKSMAATLESLLSRNPLPADWQDDMTRGLAVIASRSDALGRFMGDYARLARLPQPRLRPVNVREWLDRVVKLESRIAIVLSSGPESVIQADSDQLEQLLINLLHNAVDAALETGGGVRVSWVTTASFIEVRVEDDGPGLPNTSNLFVPFFTTKPGGSGIGLPLSRQIAENHGGSLTLENRTDAVGCLARLRLPL
jgi:nitrogen fixation/metabolism regulation signal transduction histidine kinase